MKSAYFVLMERREMNKGECLREVKGDEKWRNIWDLEVPVVTKMFLWKAGNHLLPTKVNLFKRGMVKDKKYPV